MDDDVIDPISDAPPINLTPNENAGAGSDKKYEEPPEARKSLVKEWQERVKLAKTFWKPDFDRMRANQDFILGKQWANQSSIDTEDRYIANITQRHVNQRVASLYAKNPTVVCKRKESMDFQLWDEDPNSLKTAMTVLQTAQQMMMQGEAAGIPPEQIAMSAPPEQQVMLMQARALMMDVQKGMERKSLMKRVSRTAEIYFKNKVLSQQFPPFKTSMKQLVRRVQAAGVGYVKLGISRDMEISPDTYNRIATTEETIRYLETMTKNLQENDPKLQSLNADVEELRLGLVAARSEPMKVVQEGITFDFTATTSIIWDVKLRYLQGFIGAEWGAEEYLLTPEQVQSIWGVDVLECGFTAYDYDNKALAASEPGTAKGRGTDGKFKKGAVCVWVIYSRKTGMVYSVADGVKDFLEEPGPPKLRLERFFPWFVLGFNFIEHHTQVFPISDVHIMRDAQIEYNRGRQGLREHRVANRPMTAVAEEAGLDQEDKDKLVSRPANAVVTLKGLGASRKIGDLLQAYEGPPIKAELYDPEPAFQDVQRTVGDQPANFGGTSGVTATESSIAESSRTTSLQSNADEVDDFLSELMRAAGQVALTEIGLEEVKRYVGPGAVWPTLSMQDVADEIFIDIQAGSSGRPNRAQEVQNMTQLAPILMQIPDLNRKWLAQQVLTRMDDHTDMTEAFSDGELSIQALNAVMAKTGGTGVGPGAAPPGAEDPNAQGGEGGQNVRAPERGGGSPAPQAQNMQPPPNTAPIPPGM